MQQNKTADIINNGSRAQSLEARLHSSGRKIAASASTDSLLRIMSAAAYTLSAVTCAGGVYLLGAMFYAEVSSPEAQNLASDLFTVAAATFAVGISYSTTKKYYE